jgi:hypothetical protein
VWQRSVGNFQWRLATSSEHGIFHGIGTYDLFKTRPSAGFSWLVYNRVGVAGIGWQ